MKQTIQILEDGKIVRQLNYDTKNCKFADKVFRWCVIFLLWLAAKFHMTYNEINVWLFCVIMPIVFIGLVVALILK